MAVLGGNLGRKLEAMLRGTGIKVITLPRPAVVRERDRSDRRFLRKQNYQRFFMNARRVCLDVDSIGFVDSCLFTGEAVESDVLAKLSDVLGTKVLLGAYHEDLITVVVERGREPTVMTRLREAGGKDLYIVPNKVSLRIISSVIGTDGKEKAPALIDVIDVENRKLCLYTPYQGDIQAVVVGRIRINEEWEEVGRPLKCLL
ncbi:MAG: hypothetical protein DRO12_05600 [Thermoprotei archaeon]|nr:MAG: hypothetical protein DRO12_05600 [Thermoprotei archaeon]